MILKLATIGRAARRILLVLWIICAVDVVVHLLTPKRPLNVHVGAARSWGEFFAGFFLIGTDLIGQSLAQSFQFYERMFVLAVLFCWLVLRAVRQVRELRHGH